MPNKTRGAKILSMLPNSFTLVLALLTNLWIWGIFSYNLLLGFLVILSTVFLYLHLRNDKTTSFKILLFLSFTLLLLFQWRTTNVSSLTSLDNDQKRVQQMRLNEYPPVSIQIKEKTIWIPIAHWFEGRKETIAAFRTQNNFSESLDPMLYFFANHPRERVGVKEFEKFPYILFPFFILGIFYLSKKLNIITLLLPCLILPLALISIIGNMNNLGPFSLFPFISIAISVGLTETHRRTKLLLHKSYQKALIAFAVVFVLVFLQIASYAKY